MASRGSRYCDRISAKRPAVSTGPPRAPPVSSRLLRFASGGLGCGADQRRQRLPFEVFFFLQPDETLFAPRALEQSRWIGQVAAANEVETQPSLVRSERAELHLHPAAAGEGDGLPDVDGFFFGIGHKRVDHPARPVGERPDRGLISGQNLGNLVAHAPLLAFDPHLGTAASADAYRQHRSSEGTHSPTSGRLRRRFYTQGGGQGKAEGGERPWGSLCPPGRSRGPGLRGR